MSGQTYLKRPNVLVGENLRRIREARGLTTDEVARYLSERLDKDVQTHTVQRLERGTRPTTVDEIWALADLYGLRTREAMFIEDDGVLAQLLAFEQASREAEQRARELQQAAREYESARAEVLKVMRDLRGAGVGDDYLEHYGIDGPASAAGIVEWAHDDDGKGTDPAP